METSSRLLSIAAVPAPSFGSGFRRARPASRCGGLFRFSTVSQAASASASGVRLIASKVAFAAADFDVYVMWVGFAIAAFGAAVWAIQ